MPFYAPVSLDFINKNIVAVPSLAAGFTAINGAAILNDTAVMCGQSGILIIDRSGKVLASIRTGLPISAILWGICLGTDGRLIACSQSQGFMYSDDGGYTWIKSISEPTVWCTAIVSNGAGVLVALERNTTTILRSVDNGETWVRFSGSIDSVTQSVTNTSVIFSARLNQFVIGTSGRKLNFSENGAVWVQSMAAPDYIYSVCDYGDYIYCGGDAGGGEIYRYNGVTFETVNYNLRDFASVRSGGGNVAKIGMTVLDGRMIVVDFDGFCQSMTNTESIVMTQGDVGTSANATKCAFTFNGEAYISRIGANIGKTLTR